MEQHNEKDNETIINVYKDEKMIYSTTDKQMDQAGVFGMSRKSSLSSASSSSGNDAPSTIVIDHSERWIDNLDAK